MFLIYLTTESGELLPWSLNQVEDAINAMEAFQELLSWEFLDGHPFMVWAAYNEYNLACHWCRSQPGDSGYWRGKVLEIDWLSHLH